MKTDRLYGLTVFLLNHGRTPAAALAKRFEVSERTIQRDMDALGRAGVPVVSLPGAGGGYELAEGFRMDAQLADGGDYARILTALRGLATATGDPDVSRTLEKAAARGGEEEDILLDFSVLGERRGEAIHILRNAVKARRAVMFDYTNAKLEMRTHIVEPAAVVYQWYDWYLLAYSRVREDYRTYKLARMENLRALDEGFVREHPPAREILNRLEQDPVRCEEVRLRCTPRARAALREYLNAEQDGEETMTFRAVEGERHWLGILLSLGGEVEILSPEHFRALAVRAAGDFLKVNDEP